MFGTAGVRYFRSPGVTKRWKTLFLLLFWYIWERQSDIFSTAGSHKTLKKQRFYCYFAIFGSAGVRCFRPPEVTTYWKTNICLLLFWYIWERRSEIFWPPEVRTCWKGNGFIAILSAGVRYVRPPEVIKYWPWHLFYYYFEIFGSDGVRDFRPPEVRKLWKSNGCIAIQKYLGAPEWDLFDRRKSQNIEKAFVLLIFWDIWERRSERFSTAESHKTLTKPWFYCNFEICVSAAVRYFWPPGVTKRWKSNGSITILRYLGAPEWEMFDRRESQNAEKNIGFIVILRYVWAPRWDMFDRRESQNVEKAMVVLLFCNILERRSERCSTAGSHKTLINKTTYFYIILELILFNYDT